MVLFPVCVATVFYTLAYIKANGLEMKFYTKMIAGISLLVFIYFITLWGVLKAAMAHCEVPSELGPFYFYALSNSLWRLRPVATLLYCWQFLDVVQLALIPSYRSTQRSIITIGLIAILFCLYIPWVCLSGIQSYQVHWTRKYGTSFANAA